MPVSDALIIGEDWISEHYFTTDAPKESFQGRVIERRKEWDGAEEGQSTTRSRFRAARPEIESRLVRLSDEGEGGEAPLYDQLTSVLGYTTGQWRLTSSGPLTGVSAPEAELADPVTNAPLVIIKAKGVATVDDLIAKNSETLLTPWEQDDVDPIASVATVLSTLMTDADGPAFALVLAGRWALVAEKERWPEGRWLAVDLQLVCERNEYKKRGGEVDRALVCLDAQSLAPDASGGTWWSETLEASIKHTVGVSKDLQDGVRESIEIIANEVVRRRRDQGLEPLADDQAQVLAVQSLRYLYRILFLLYAEASPELGVLPVGAEEYDAGYGLDRLRDLALTEVHDARERSRTHLYASLEGLFRLVDRGHTPQGEASLPEGLVFNALRADLFTPEATARINEVKLGNDALLQVLRKLLLSKEEGSKQRGFISYVELGINQLGAVYEGLMSYTGSFASEDLYEVAMNGDPSDGSWVVPISRSDHLDPSHFVRRPDEETGMERPVMYRQGEFVFRLSGRDRQRSASYYTPEVLTRFTVQQALEELLDQDGTTTTAEEILDLTICEPALGSGAFAIEAVRQLAEEYISRREAELGEKVDPDQRPEEVQKAKAHIALHQVYGVDLNSTAVELAEVSLWLDTMVKGLKAPWFGLRLRQGNSLVGARRALYPERQIKDRSWLTTPPQDADLSGLAAAIDEGRNYDPSITRTQVHHFLLPAQGWGSASEVPKSVRDIVPEKRLKDIKTWRRSLRRRLSVRELKRLQVLAQRVEALWAISLRRLRIAEEESGRTIDLWGRESESAWHAVTREQIEASLANDDGACQRLRLVMDAWCALWYWPLTDLDAEPPTMDQWLDACEQILGRAASTERKGMSVLSTTTGWDELGEAEELDLQFAGAQRVERVREDHPWLRVCENVAKAQAFFHWEMDFATVFARGGFNLQVGNPPWVVVEEDLRGVLADFDPWWKLGKGAKDALRHLGESIDAESLSAIAILGASQGTAALKSFLGAVYYPDMTVSKDLYRAFICLSPRLASRDGIVSFVHPDTHLTDDKASGLRRAAYRRLRRNWQFINEKKLFEIQNQKRFGVSVYGSERSPEFLRGSGFYVPATVVSSLRHDGTGEVPGVKNRDGSWNTSAHLERIQRVDLRTLQLWSKISAVGIGDSPPMASTLTESAARVLARVADSPRIAEFSPQFIGGLTEAEAREIAVIERYDSVPFNEAILSGVHIDVHNPMFQEPRSTMKSQRDNESIDTEAMAKFPVLGTKWSGSRTPDEVESRQGRNERNDSYRIMWRRMVDNSMERTLMASVVPPGVRHDDGVMALSFEAGVEGLSKLALACAGISSMVGDYFVRAYPKNNVRGGTVGRMPMLNPAFRLQSAVILRVLQLNCVNGWYEDLWTSLWSDEFSQDEPVLERVSIALPGPAYSMSAIARRDVDRRNIQIELDALAALAMGVKDDELIALYRGEFSVLLGKDLALKKSAEKYVFDRNGRLVPSAVQQAWRRRDEPICNSDMSLDERQMMHPGSGVVYTYDLPFGTLDRQADFRTAYAEFERRLAVAEGTSA